MSLERIACTAMCPNVAPSSTTLKRTSLSPVLRRSQPSSRSSLGDFDPILAKRAKKLRGRARAVLQSRRYLVIISAAVQPRRPVALKRPSPLVATGRVVSADSSRRGDTLTRRFRVYSGLRRSDHIFLFFACPRHGLSFNVRCTSIQRSRGKNKQRQSACWNITLVDLGE